MKMCIKCKIEKKSEDFCKSSKNKDGLQSWCKRCVSEARMRRYHENRETERAKGNARNKQAYENNMRKLMGYLAVNPCVDCGEDDPIVLEFDHRNPKEKAASISNMANNYFKWNKIQTEIEKCEVRCANCHRRRTAKQFGYYAYLI